MRVTQLKHGYTSEYSTTEGVPHHIAFQDQTLFPLETFQGQGSQKGLSARAGLDQTCGTQPLQCDGLGRSIAGVS